MYIYSCVYMYVVLMGHHSNKYFVLETGYNIIRLMLDISTTHNVNKRYARRTRLYLM